jgi:hypothetical protein
MNIVEQAGMNALFGTTHGAASGSNEIDDASNNAEAKKPRARSPSPTPQDDVPVVTTGGGQSYADVDGVNAQASQAEASLERAAVGEGRIARSVDGLCWGALSTRRRRDARCDPYFKRTGATWTRSPMHTESGEFCSKVVAAEALGHNKGDLGIAQESGGVGHRGEKPSSAIGRWPMSTRRRRDARCDTYFGRTCATWTRRPMHTESGEFCSKVVAAEALGHDKGDLGTAHDHGHEMPTSQWVRGTDLEQFVRISLV